MAARSLLLAALFMAFTAAPGSAGASSPYVPPAATTPDQKYAACIATRDRMGSARLVLAEPGTDAEKAATASLASTLRDCDRRVLHGAAEPDHALLRGLIAEQLWVANIWQVSSSDSLDPNKINVDKGFDAVPALRDAYRLAACVAAIRPEAIDALLRTTPSSDAEQAAFEMLKPPISSCFPRGRSLALQRPMLRALLAEQLYRLLPPPGSGAPLYRRMRPVAPGVIAIPGQTNGTPMEKQNSH